MRTRILQAGNLAGLIRVLKGMVGNSQTFVVAEEAEVLAPIGRCFALSTHLAVVELTLAMRPVSGRIEGSVVGGDTVRWRGWKWGLPQIHESLIEAYDPPFFFRDRMTAGRFAAFEHDHQFTARENGSVLLRDEVRFSMRWGAPGVMIARGLVLPHVRNLIRDRFALIKRLAEGEGWREFLS